MWVKYFGILLWIITFLLWPTSFWIVLLNVPKSSQLIGCAWLGFSTGMMKFRFCLLALVIRNLSVSCIVDAEFSLVVLCISLSEYFTKRRNMCYHEIPLFFFFLIEKFSRVVRSCYCCSECNLRLTLLPAAQRFWEKPRT